MTQHYYYNGQTYCDIIEARQRAGNDVLSGLTESAAIYTSHTRKIAVGRVIYSPKGHDVLMWCTASSSRPMGLDGSVRSSVVMSRLGKP